MRGDAAPCNLSFLLAAHIDYTRIPSAPYISLSMTSPTEPHALYHSTLPLTLTHPTKDPHTQSVQLTLTTTPTASPASFTTLHIQLTSADDPYFLYLSDVTDADFTAIKREQHLNIDFHTFPAELRRLLDSTLTTPSPPYLLSLCVADGLLRVVAVSHFRQVDFLVLRMRVATDGQLKAQLVGEMTRWKRLADEWASKCQLAEKERREAEERERVGGRRWNDAREKEQASLAALYKQHADDIQSLNTQHTTAAHDMQRKHEEAVQQLVKEEKERQRQLMAQLAEATDKAERATTLYHTTQHELGIKRTALDTLHTQHNTLQSQHSALTVEHSSTVDQLSTAQQHNQELDRRLLHLQQQLNDATQLQERTERSMTAEREQRAVFEEGMRVMRERAEGLESKVEAAVNEIHRGNDVISRLNARIQQQKDKSDRRKRALLAQEKRVKQLEDDKRDGDKQAMELRMANERGEAERERLKERLTTAERTIDEYSAQLKENVSTINYLNSRENEKVLRGLGGSTAASGVLSSLFPASTASLTTSVPSLAVLSSLSAPASASSASAAVPSSSSHAVGHGGAPFTPASHSSASSSFGSRFYSLADLATTPLSVPSQPGNPPSASVAAADTTPLPIEKRLSAIARQHLGLSSRASDGGVERGRLGGSVRVLSSLSSFAPPASAAASGTGKERSEEKEKQRGQGNDKQQFVLQVNDENVNVSNRPAAVSATS